MADKQPHVDEKILSGAGDTLAKAGKIGTFDGMCVRSPFGQGVGIDVAINLALEPTLAKEFVEFVFVRVLIHVGWDPFDAEKGGGEIAVVSARGGLHQVFDNAVEPQMDLHAR